MKRLLLSSLAAFSLLVVGCSGPSTKGPTPAQVAAASAQVDADSTPAALRGEYMDLLTSGEREYVALAMRLGLDAARMGENQFAARIFDGAIKRVEALQEGAAQAERAKSNFVAEQEKWFKGETYERAALYLYRGLLYLEAGDYGNAAACGKRVELEDISSHEEDQGDWYSGEWLLASASLLQGDPGTAHDALARAANFFSRQGTVPPPDPKWNVIIIGEAGNAPIKVRRGQYGEELYIEEGNCRTVRISVSANTVPPPPQLTVAAENIYHQASTRGDRRVDHILAGKAVFKTATDVAGDAAIVAGAGTVATSNSQTQSLVGLGLVVGGVITKAVSGASKPEADIRSWDNLPHSIFLTGLRCPPGVLSKIKIEALDGAGLAVAETTKDVMVSDNSSKTFIWQKFP